MDAENYPESVKFRQASAESQSIGEFLDWLQSQGYWLCKIDEKRGTLYHSDPGFNNLLAEYFGIDLEAREKEVRAMLEEWREKQGI